MRFFFKGFAFSRTRVHCLALLAAGLLFGNQLPAFAYQTGDPTMTGYTTPPPTGGTTTDDPTMTGYTPPPPTEDPTTNDPPPPQSYPPYAMDDWYQTSYNNTIVFDPLDNDYGISSMLDPSSLVIELPPSNGTAEIDPQTGLVVYTPDAGFAGTDSFLYTVADFDGNVSNLAMVDIDVINIAPTLISFTVVEGSINVWHFEGEVADENLVGCTIIFGGLLNGETTTVNSDGTFIFSKIIQDGVNGTVSARARDELGELSTVLYDEVYHF